MKSLKQYLNLTGKAVKNAFIHLENMFVIVKSNSENKLNKKIVEEAVKENIPVCITFIENKNENTLSLNPDNIFFPDMFLRRKDRVKKLCLELQNA